MFCLFLVSAVRDEGQKGESSQDGQKEQSGPVGEQILLQGRFQNAVVCQRCPEAHDGVLEQTVETGGEDSSSLWSIRSPVACAFGV